MDKNKSLKNSAQDITMDSKEDEKKSNISDNITDSRKPELSDESSDNKKSNESCNSTDDFNCFDIDLAVLNEISKIAQMGMSSISFLTNKISDKEMKKLLVSMYSQYSNILHQVNQHFEKYGEIPEDTPRYTKMMSCYGIKMNLLRDSTNSHIAEMMIQGTLMGVIECQKILNCNLCIEDSTTDLLKNFNKFQRENINKLNAFL